MRKGIYIVILLLISSFTYSQGIPIDVDYVEITDSTVLKREITPNKKQKLKFGLNAGMSYTFASNGMGGSGFSLSPYLSYPISDKLVINAGLSMQNGFYYSPFAQNYSDYSNNQMLPMTRMYLFVSGNYLVNDKFTVSGSVYQRVLDVPNPNKVSDNYQFNEKGMSFGISYKLTPNISIGAQISVESPGYGFDMFQPGYSNYYPGNW